MRPPRGRCSPVRIRGNSHTLVEKQKILSKFLGAKSGSIFIRGNSEDIALEAAGVNAPRSRLECVDSDSIRWEIKMFIFSSRAGIIVISWPDHISELFQWK